MDNEIKVGDYIKAKQLFGTDELYLVDAIANNQVVIVFKNDLVNVSMQYIDEIWVRKA